MANIIKVEFTSKIDKSIYENSPWKTKEEFFKDLIINHVDTDLKFFKRESEKMKGKQKQNYELFIQSLGEMKDSIHNSIQYEVLGLEDNIQELKISFSFKYYETKIITPERMVEGFIFMTPMQDIKIFAEDLEKMKEQPGRVPEEEKEKVDSAIKMFYAAIEFMDNAKSSLIATKDGVEMKEIFNTLNKKLKK